jgi:signal peptidase I
MQPEKKDGFYAYLKDQFAPFKSFFGFVAEITKIVVISLAIILPIRYFLIQPFYVKGASMEPTFYTHDYLIVNEIGYRLNDPERGDIVIFRYPKDPSQYFIKRIIGLPGERVVVGDNKVTIYNEEYKDGLLLKEDYLSPDEVTNLNLDIHLQDDKYIVLGDNRDESLDSRNFGSVPRKNIIGKVWLRGWPFTRFGTMEKAIY